MEYKEKVSSGAYRCFVALFLLCLVHSIQAQKSDKELFVQFENQFSLLDSLIFKQQSLQPSSLPGIAEVSGRELQEAVDSLIYAKVENQKEGMKAFLERRKPEFTGK